MILIPIIMLILLAIGLTRYMIGHDRGEREPIKALWLVFGLGLLGAIMAALLEQCIPSNLLSVTNVAPITISEFAAALAVGFIEEACKFLPAALFLYRKRYFNEHNDGIIYFAIAGLGFGLPENVLYTLAFGANAGFTRVILTPFFHAAMTAFIGYFLARSKVDKKSLASVVIAYLVVAVLHGVYDFGLFTHSALVLLSICITLGMTITLFVLYGRATHEDQAEGLSVVGNNSFCRTCGQPNPTHHLYCQNCGSRA